MGSQQEFFSKVASGLRSQLLINSQNHSSNLVTILVIVTKKTVFDSPTSEKTTLLVPILNFSIYGYKTEHLFITFSFYLKQIKALIPNILLSFTTNLYHSFNILIEIFKTKNWIVHN